MKKMMCSILALLLICMLSGCSGSNTIAKKDAPFPVTVGNATILEKPERVASLSAPFTNILRDLGYGETLVAVSDEEAEGTSLAAIGTALVPDIAAIKEAKPEVLFTSSPMASAQLDELFESGIQVIILEPVTSLETLYARYYDVIAAMDGKAEANTAGVALTDAMKGDVERLLAKLPEQKATFVLLCTTDPFVATPDTLESNLLSLLGVNAVSGENYVSDEALGTLKADILLYDAAIDEEEIKEEKDLGKISETAKPIERTKLLTGTKDVIEQLRVIASVMYPEIDFTDEALSAGADEPESSAENSEE